MKKLSILAILTIGVLGCTSQKSQDFPLSEACNVLDSVDQEMLTTYQKIEQAYRGNKDFLDKLNMAQVYWIQYRDRHIKSLYPLSKKEYEPLYGQTYRDCRCKENVRLTQLRTKELERWLENEVIEGCPSSIQAN